MDMNVLEDLQHLCLTKDEEKDIQISPMNRSDLIEECALSLFGKLLTDKHQNQHALKSTLRVAWKMCSNLRIVDVGKNIYQFKFNSEFQLEWVERNSPWNSTIICFFSANGKGASRDQILLSLMLLFGFKFGASLSKTCLRMLEKIWVTAWGII